MPGRCVWAWAGRKVCAGCGVGRQGRAGRDGGMLCGCTGRGIRRYRNRTVQCVQWGCVAACSFFSQSQKNKAGVVERFFEMGLLRALQLV